MAHIDRQPSQEIFEDIKSAAKSTWGLLNLRHNLHDSYYEEKMRHIAGITNYADNWYSYIGNMDQINQRILFSYLKRRDTKEFLIKQSHHYLYPKPLLEEI